MKECQIETYFHCRKCIDNLPAGQSPKEYQRIQTGWTKKGVQVWCVRHDEEIVHLDFLGQKISFA